MRTKTKIGILVSSSLSGGNNVIFEHAFHIHQRNRVEVTLIFPTETSDADLSWFPRICGVPRMTLSEAENHEFDCVIATYWRTCFQLNKLNAKAYLYFNQSVESRFFDEKDFNSISAAESAYLLGLPIITEANWIKNYVKEKYDQDAIVVHNGINKKNYSTTGEVESEREPDKLRILIEGNVSSKFKNVPKTVDICKRSHADEVWLLTNSDIEYYEGVDRVFSNIPIHETQKIYRSCDVLVKLSTVEGMFGPPLEMFHCGGTAITYDVTGHDEYLVSGHNSFVAKMHEEEKTLQFINTLKATPETLQLLKDNAIKTAENWYDWSAASEKFETAVIQSINKPQVPREVLKTKTELLVNWFEKTKIVISENERNKKKIGLKVHNQLKKILGR